MRIIAYINNDSGPHYHRLITPLRNMKGVDVEFATVLQVAHFQKGCDLFIYNRHIPEQWLGQVNNLRAVMGFKICVDVDDYWHLDEHHVSFNEYAENDYAKKQVEQIQNADLVTTTHSRLADQIKEFNKNVYVLPNAIPKQGQFDIQREKSQQTRLFWQGSATHQEDTALIKPALQQFAYSKEIEMVIGGHNDDDPVRVATMLNMTGGLTLNHRMYYELPVNGYYHVYAHADICLIPLLNTRFNAFKSNLKVLEAANLGLPVICSQVHPYMDLPVIYAKGTGDWVRNIQRLVASKKRQRDAGEELKEFCDREFNFDKINEERRQILSHQMHVA